MQRLSGFRIALREDHAKIPVAFADKALGVAVHDNAVCRVVGEAERHGVTLAFVAGEYDGIDVGLIHAAESGAGRLGQFVSVALVGARTAAQHDLTGEEMLFQHCIVPFETTGGDDDTLAGVNATGLPGDPCLYADDALLIHKQAPDCGISANITAMIEAATNESNDQGVAHADLSGDQAPEEFRRRAKA